jgi:hypothetical protein
MRWLWEILCVGKEVRESLKRIEAKLDRLLTSERVTPGDLKALDKLKEQVDLLAQKGTP